MPMSGLALCSVAICFRAWRAYCCPGPGSSDAIRLMAACASVKIVTLSGVVFLLTATSNAHARAAPGMWNLETLRCHDMYPHGDVRVTRHMATYSSYFYSTVSKF